MNIPFLRSFITALLSLIVLASAYATTLTVYSAADAGGTCPGADCTLRQALATVASGDTINFGDGISTITLTSGELLINQAITIDGPGPHLLTVQRNSATDFRIFNVAFVSLFSNVTISGLTISNGSATAGAGIYASHETLAITDCIISDNTATSGGGLYTDPNAQVTITNCTFANNKAMDGGGIYNVHSNTMTLVNSTVAGNSANGGTGSGSGGGGIYNGTGCSLTLTNVTVTGNSTGATGGGVWNNGTATINNCTIADNSSVQDAGGLFNIHTATLSNTIIATNTGRAVDRDIDGSCTSQGYNLIGEAGTSGLSNGTNNDQVGASGAAIAPKLDTLRDNGGPTFTRALLSGSTAIDKGKSAASTTDQRGLARPVVAQSTALPSGGDGSDIGAYELQADQLPACKGVNTVVANNNDGGLGSLRDIVASVCVGSTVTFAPSVRGSISLTAGQIIIDRNLTITGPGANVLTVERDSASPSARIFNIAASRNVTISGLTISNGTAPSDRGGGILNSGTLTLINDTVSQNSAIGGNGGGIYTSGTLTVTGSTVSGNKIDSSTAGSGGGIFNFGAAVTITNSTISGNSAVSGPAGTSDHGGGIYSNVGSVTLTSSTDRKSVV